MTQTTIKMTMTPIGSVQREGTHTYIEVGKEYKSALRHLDHFSHVNVFWWAQQLDTPEARQVLVTPLPYAPEVESGVFATRSPQRPNPIMITSCKILGLDENSGKLTIENIDAFDDTPVVDLKAYFPVTDRVRDAHIPEWLQGWPEWLPEGGIGLQ
jgi:tRNA (adenine37-N6)-methyltransferase